MTELSELKDLLLQEGYTCVLSNGTDTVTSRERGVKPLIGFRESGKDFTGYMAADKIVGRAAAFLYSNMGIAALHACVIGRAAIDVCRQHKIAVSYDTETETIINRNGDGVCPMEQLVRDIQDPAVAESVIAEALKTHI